MDTNTSTRVVVAMSGGVDSSVAAALLVQQGYDVVGMMMRLWAEDTIEGASHNRCCTPDQMADAERVAHILGIPFYVIDTKATFRNTVVQFFVDQHRAGLTPNPCLECNRQIRFTFLQEQALALGARYLATGHYARITQAADGLFELRGGLDAHKDQSYVLSVMGQHQLAHALFPIGGMAKPAVRRVAEDLALPVFNKQDSQDLCFLGDGDYRRFLADHAPDMLVAGPMVTREGVTVGSHTGLANYTIGQRRGLGITSVQPLYVIEKDVAANTLVVGPAETLGRAALVARRANWVSGRAPSAPFRAHVKIRYKAAPVDALITPLGDDTFRADFDGPLRDITPGQGAVLYHDDLCLGGGTITPGDAQP